jgi:hypothetical protein
MNTLGSTTNTKIVKIGSHILTHAFNVDGLKNTITLDADFVSLNVINGFIGGVAVTGTYATSHAATMTALAATIAALPTIKSASVTSARVITLYPKDQVNGIGVTGFVITLGASQAGVVAAQVDNRVSPGQPVELLSNGKIAPVTAATADLTNIGYALDDQRNDTNALVVDPQEVSVALRGMGMITNCEYSIVSGLVGPVASAGWNTVTGKQKVTSTGVTVANQIGWAVTAGTSIGDPTAVILK